MDSIYKELEVTEGADIKTSASPKDVAHAILQLACGVASKSDNLFQTLSYSSHDDINEYRQHLVKLAVAVIQAIKITDYQSDEIFKPIV